MSERSKLKKEDERKRQKDVAIILILLIIFSALCIIIAEGSPDGNSQFSTWADQPKGCDTL